ncbi:MAG: hypothetical protein AB1567_01840 [bacterium]
MDFADMSSVNAIVQNFEYVRRILIDKYGHPTNFYETGEVDAELINNIKNRTFIRNYEWTKEDGVIRFGIPERLDGKIRMELQFANEFPTIQETLWSIEEIK